MKPGVFKRVGIVGRVQKPTIRESLAVVLDVLQSEGCTVAVEVETVDFVNSGSAQVVSRQELGECDLVIVVGGDGSILGVARDLAHSDVLVLGVNRGGLGFLADIFPDQIEQGISAVLKGKYQLEVRFLLEHSVLRDNEIVHQSLALNDVVVNSGSITRMMEFNLLINDEYVYSQRSDGLIVSTPTGSTAYALSAGGPIMHPTLDAIVVVPMFPHSLSSRSLVVKGESEIVIYVSTSESVPLVTADSQSPYILQPNDRVRIRKYPHGLNIAYPAHHNFYESCRSKLDWASRLGEKEKP